jgi:hypothetical protein
MAGFALGYLSPGTFHDLTIIREIRNLFAHQYGPATFEDAAVTSLVARLKAADEGLAYVRSSTSLAHAIRDAAGRNPSQETITPTMERVKWALTVVWIVTALEAATAKYKITAEAGRTPRLFVV